MIDFIILVLLLVGTAIVVVGGAALLVFLGAVLLVALAIGSPVLIVYFICRRRKA